MKPKEIQEELVKVVNECLCHREALAVLEKRRTDLIKLARGFSSSVKSSEAVGAPGVIQGPPPAKKEE